MSNVYKTADRIESAVARFRITFAAAGILAVIAGLLILLWPELALNVVAMIVGIYALVAGAIFLAMGIFGKDFEGWAKASRIIVGAIFVVAGVFALLFSNVTASVLVWTIAIIVGVMWIAEGVVTLTLTVKSQPNVWTIVYIVISIAAGVLVLMSPLMDVNILRWLLGLSFIALGASQIIRAARFGRGSVEIEVDAKTV